MIIKQGRRNSDEQLQITFKVGATEGHSTQIAYMNMQYNDKNGKRIAGNDNAQLAYITLPEVITLRDELNKLIKRMTLV